MGEGSGAGGEDGTGEESSHVREREAWGDREYVLGQRESGLGQWLEHGYRGLGLQMWKEFFLNDLCVCVCVFSRFPRLGS